MLGGYLRIENIAQKISLKTLLHTVKILKGSRIKYDCEKRFPSFLHLVRCPAAPY